MQELPARYDINKSGTALLYVNAKWCGACKSARPTMIQVAKTLRESGVPVYDVDEAKHGDLVERWGVKAFPTILLVGRAGILKYEGQRTLDNLVTFVCLNGDGRYGFCKRVRVPS